MPMKTTLETRPGAAGHLVAGQRPRAGDDLLDDLGGGHVALEAALAGRAERAGHAAAGLAGDAHRDAARVAHQHRLDEGAVEEPPQGLAGGAPVGLQRAQRRHQRGQQRGDELVALRRPGGRSSRPGRRPAGRSSGSRAAWPGSPGSPSSSSTSSARSPAVRSARWRGGFLRPRGSSKTSGSAVVPADSGEGLSDIAHDHPIRAAAGRKRGSALRRRSGPCSRARARRRRAPRAP